LTGHKGAVPDPLERRMAADRSRLHGDEAGALQMLDEALRHDLCHDLVGVVDPFAALKAQCERRSASAALAQP